MDIQIIAIVCAVVAALLTPVYVVLLVKGVRTLSDLRSLLRRPVRERETAARRPDAGAGRP